jgi:NAD(P)-dependent dehydrogenase (short-subunit alcohol dehydrogenase family)
MGSEDSSRVWLITGSSSGFGRSLAEAALERGDRVAATARRPESLDELVARDPGRVLALALDVTQSDQVGAAVDAAIDRFGAVDALVNNAGYGSVGAVEEIDMNDLRVLMDTMFFGAVAMTQALIPHMRERGSGAIVQISSMGGQVSAPGFGAYCAAKFALEGLSESLAAEVEPLGIRVLIVEPGAFRTGFGGGRMHRSGESDVYAGTVGQTRAYVDGMDGTQPGDPHKAALAIIDAVDAAEAPLHLALGTDAVEAIRDQHESLQADLAAWESVSRSTALADA